MGKRRPRKRLSAQSSPGGRRRGKRRRPAGGVGVCKASDGKAWLLDHPRCVRQRADDLDAVRQMIAEGEHDVAIDELRWLLDGCSELIEAHYLLGKLAVEADGDVELARGHFGFGFQLGDKALRRAGDPQPTPALHPANRAFFDSGRGLAWCLHELGKDDLAIELIRRLLACDALDPLGLAGWLDEIHTAGVPLVTPDQLFQPPSGS